MSLLLQQEDRPISRHHTFLAWRMGAISQDEVTAEYEEWCARPISLVFSHGERVFERLASKRGNSIYEWNMRAKLDALASAISPLVKVKGSTTNAVFVTLTDPHTGPAPEAWLSLGERWNRLLAALTKRHGRPVFIRSWESTKRGYPHVHAILVFPNETFKTQLRWSDRDRQYVTRVNGTRAWKRYWLGHMDVRGVESPQRATWYLSKEILKYETGVHAGDKGRLTLAILWASGRRSFSCSRSLNVDLTKAQSLREPEASVTDRPEAGRLDAIQGSKSNSNSLRVLGLSIPDFEAHPLVFEGIGRRSDVLKYRVEGSPDGAWSYELVALPPGLHQVHRKRALVFDDAPHYRIASGRPFARRGSLEPWLEDYADLYDELTIKARDAMNVWRDRERRRGGWPSGGEGFEDRYPIDARAIDLQRLLWQDHQSEANAKEELA